MASFHINSLFLTYLCSTFYRVTTALYPSHILSHSTTLTTLLSALTPIQSHCPRLCFKLKKAFHVTYLVHSLEPEFSKKTRTNLRRITTTTTQTPTTPTSPTSPFYLHLVQPWTPHPQTHSQPFRLQAQCQTCTSRAYYTLQIHPHHN
jgi:hypothetical protein